jgi:hypothetical protein
MTRRLIRFLRRLLVFGLGVFTVWFLVFVVFRFADHQFHWILALAVTYGLAAYVILPRVVLISLKILNRKHVPRYTITPDGLPGDPVNLVLVGTLDQLKAAFVHAGWSPADRLSLASSWRMVRAFVLNTPYPTAPFSTLYLFGRGQDVGFQKAIDDSPRKRHHVRFWALSVARAAVAVGTESLWHATERPSPHEHNFWVGAATKDIGLSLTWLTFKFTHSTDADTNAERDFVVAELADKRVIAGATSYKANQRLQVAPVNHYVTDGEVTVANLTVGPEVKAPGPPNAPTAQAAAMPSVGKN